jgi:acetyl-CoA synthetase
MYFTAKGGKQMSEVVWKPSEEYIEKANITRFMRKHNIKDYDELIEKSTDDLTWFWDEVIKDLNIEFYKPYTKVYDDSEGIQWTKWFVDGKINIVHNVIDRWAKSDKKNNTAIIWEN